MELKEQMMAAMAGNEIWIKTTMAINDVWCLNLVTTTTTNVIGLRIINKHTKRS